MGVEPIPDEPAALVETEAKRLLAIADYHAGIETVLRSDGVEIDSRGQSRRRRLLDLVTQHTPDRLLILGDMVHAIGEPWEAEREELELLFEQLSVPVTLVRGNHDSALESVISELDCEVTLTEASGTRIGDVGFVHGHTWPSVEVLTAPVVCMGHEHPVVRLEDSVGGARIERVWLRGRMDETVFLERDRYEGIDVSGHLVVFPAFNDLSGGTWVNVDGQEFLSPFLPASLPDGEAYLLDGTRLGPFRRV